MTLAGPTPSEALAGATSRTAAIFGLSDRGRITAGASADLVLVDGDPFKTIAATLNTRTVWRRGHRIDVSTQAA